MLDNLRLKFIRPLATEAFFCKYDTAVNLLGQLSFRKISDCISLGYILGELWLSYETVTPIQKSDIYLLCKTIVESGRQYARRHRLPCPLQYAYYKVEYLGAAHGLCSILQVLLSVPGYLDSQPSDAADIKQSIDYLLSLQDKEGRWFL